APVGEVVGEHAEAAGVLLVARDVAPELRDPRLAGRADAAGGALRLAAGAHLGAIVAFTVELVVDLFHGPFLIHRSNNGRTGNALIKCVGARADRKSGV